MPQVARKFLLAGLKRFREASLVLEEGLKIDPFNAALKAILDEANQGVLGDILAGLNFYQNNWFSCNDSFASYNFFSVSVSIISHDV